MINNFLNPNTLLQTATDASFFAIMAVGMTAFVLVFSHPYYATTESDGRFRIDNIPPGSYTVTVWHEGQTRDSRTVGTSSASSIEATLRLIEQTGSSRSGWPRCHLEMSSTACRTTCSRRVRPSGLTSETRRKQGLGSFQIRSSIYFRITGGLGT